MKDESNISPRLRTISERMDRFVAVIEPVTNAIWWLYLIGLAVTAYLIRDHLGWDDVQGALLLTVAAIIAYIVLLILLVGAFHVWKASLLFGMIGGFAGQVVGCLIGVALAGVIGAVALLVETRPLREAARQRRLSGQLAPRH